ncbi:hypothetical protein BLNAU_18814 [Blattamonas nauphoetae]|uniref:Right handed beta helix domain-containing protein n=1 Tax=Blattamonas nauphoetae TaxID=2049346 RepID=A0ABQ9X3Z4_9EUKA|nr:hypothetical protein BLNAU_18814 [Blattamonas nauphoetae]
MTTFQLLLIVFSFGRTKDSRIFDDQFEHIHSQSAQDVSSLMKTHPGPTINLHIEDRIEILHSLTLENRHIVITAPTACSFDACTSVSSSGCRFTNISSVPNASPNMPPHFRTHYKQLLSSMDMAHSEHGLYGLVSSDINSGGDFLFKNTSFSHCTTTETGQAYDQDHPCTDGSVTTFDSCTFTSMTSTSPGAGLWRQNAVSLTLISCTFTECVSTVAQGHHGGGLCAYNCDTVNLEGTNKFDRCVCKGGAGGGYFISETTTTLVVSGVKCEDCSNSDGSGYYGNGGGGFLGMNKAPEAAVQITNCEFTGCTSTSTGGLTVNIAWTVVSSCKFTDCEGNGHERGGGLNFYPTGTHTLSFSSFTNCSHLTGIGGGVAFAGKSTITMDSVDFVDCHTDNGQGGGCWANGVVVLESVTFTNCYALNGEGGGCYLGNGSSVEVKDCSFTDCNITLDSYATGGGALAGT